MEISQPAVTGGEKGGANETKNVNTYPRRTRPRHGLALSWPALWNVPRLAHRPRPSPLLPPSLSLPCPLRGLAWLHIAVVRMRLWVCVWWSWDSVQE